MSEFLAEARILVRPDTTGFRAELIREIQVATRGVIAAVPVTANLAAASSGFGVLSTQAAAAAGAFNEVADAEKRGAEESKKANQERARTSKNLGQVQTAAFAAGAGLTGLRGAVLTAGGAFLAATVAIQAAIKAIQSAAALETELNVFRATTQATAEEMERVRDQARALGADIRLPGVAASDAAVAFTELAKAGLDVEQSLAGARGVLQLASAAQITFAESAELTANALNAFALGGDEAIQVADLLANASNLAQGSVADMGIALRQSAGAASQIGLTIEDTVGLLTALARAGLAGSDAGTTLRVALLRLVAPTKNAQEALNRFNIDLRDEGGRVRVQALFELEEALRGVSEADADRARVAIFGQNAFRVSALLGRESAESFEELTVALERQGAAAELAGARAEGFAGSLAALQNSLSTLGAVLGGFVTGPLGDLAEGTARAANLTTRLLEGLEKIKNAAPKDEKDAGVDVFSNLPAIFNEATASAELFRRSLAGEDADIALPGRALETLERMNQEALRAENIIGDVGAEAEALFAIFKESGGGLTALDQLVRGLDEMADKLSEGDARAQRFAAELREIIKEIQATGDIPPTLIDIQARLDEAQVRSETERAGNAILDALGDALDPSKGFKIGEAFMVEGVAAGIDTGADAVVQSLSTGLAVAVAEGDEARQLAILEQQLRATQRRRARLEAQFAESPGPRLDAGIRRQAEEEARIQREIDAIRNRQASRREESAREQERNARDAAEARRDADEALLGTFANRREDAQRRISAAAETSTLRDDIRRQNELQALIKIQIQKIRDRIKDEKLKAAAIRELRQALIDSRREEDRLRQQQRDDRLERAAEIADLNIQIAQERGNEAAQERAIRQRLALIKRQIAAAKGDQVKIKQLILERERLKNDLDELNEAEEDNRNKAAEFFFSQLQAQQGFASNLLGNLITGSTEGLVGAPSPTAPTPEARITAEVQAERGLSTGGPSAGQVSTTNDILLRILQQLKALNGETAAPEARYQRRTASGSMDTQTM